jgi:hypothetical protein
MLNQLLWNELEVKMNISYECLWTVRQWRKGEVVWEVVNKKNLLADEGEKAVLDTFFRNNAASYFSANKFWVGLFNGSISETTVLATIPNEPAVANGYSRMSIERSSIGWPTIEKNEGDWRVVSGEIKFIAVGGSIGPVNGAFLSTSSDSSGALVGSLSFGTERPFPAGDSITMQLRAKLK